MTEVVRLDDAAKMTGVSRRKLEQLIDEGIVTSFKVLMNVNDFNRNWVKVIPWDQLEVIERWRKNGELIQEARSLHKISKMAVSEFLDERENELYDEIEFINGMRNYLERYGF